MLYSLKTNDVSAYQGDKNALYDYVGAISPDSAVIIDALADTATGIIEKYIGTPLGKRPIRLVISRGEAEVNDGYFRSWQQSGSTFSGGMNGNVNQWIEFPTPDIDSIQSVTIGSWQSTDKIQLVENQDFIMDYDSANPRMMFSYPLFIQDYFYKYKNIIIDYVGGIYDVNGQVPLPIDTAIKYLTKNMFDQRGGQQTNYFDNGYKFLLANYKAPAIAGGRT